MELQHQRIGPYVIQSELGRGGMGVVYRATQLELDREVAVKVMLSGQHAGDEAYDRFVREARAAGKLRHPNIVPVHDVGVHDGLPYIVMDFVPGQSLAELLAEGDLPVRRGLEIVRDVAHALHDAHEHDVIHRDVKPGNILIEAETGRALLTDFGLAREVGSDAGLTRSGATLGTPAYMSPEQAKSDPVDRRTDVYGIGAVLYEVLTGRAPFEGDSPYSILGQVIKQEPAKVRALTSAVSRDVELICETAMAKELERRYHTAGLMAEDIERWLRGEAISARAPSMMYLLSRRAKRHRVPLFATIASLLATVAAVYWLGVRPGMVQAEADRAVLRRALSNKQAKETEFAGHLAASRWTDAITLGRGLWGITPAVPDLHDRNIGDEAEFSPLRRPYGIDLPRAYLARGAERIDSGDPLARGDLANAFQLGRDLPAYRATARAALVAMGSGLAERHDLDEANYIAALAHDSFGTTNAGMRALLARVAQANDRHGEAVALWDSLAADPEYADEAAFQLGWMKPALPRRTIPDPGVGWVLLRAAPSGGIAAADYDDSGAVLVRTWSDEAWSEPQRAELTPPEGFSPAHCTVADVDGDGFNDLVCHARAAKPARTWVVVCRRRPDGGWRAGEGATTPDHPGTFTSGDFMADGVRDLWANAGRGFVLMHWQDDRLTFGGQFYTGNYASHASITPEGDLLAYIAPFLAEAARKPIWRRGQSGLWLQTPNGVPEPATNANWPGGAGFPWGYRVLRLRDRGDGWVLPVEQLGGRYGWGHISVMPDQRLLVRSQAGADMQIIVPGITNGLVMTDDRDGRFSAPVAFGDPETYRRLGSAGWWVWPVAGERWYGTWGRGGVWRLVTPDGAGERHIGLAVNPQRFEFDDDPNPELVERDTREASRPMVVRGLGAFTAPLLESIDLELDGGRTLPAGLTPEQQLFDAGLYAELIEVCQERLAAGGDRHWHYEMGRAQLALEQWAPAAAAFEAAAQDAVLAPDALLRRVQALEQLRDWPALRVTLERLVHKRQRDTFARDAVAHKLAWVKAAQKLQPVVDWTDWSKIPLQIADPMQTAWGEDGLRVGASAGANNGAGALVTYAGGPIRLTGRFEHGRFGWSNLAAFYFRRVEDDGRYPAGNSPYLWAGQRIYGANDRPGIAWRSTSLSRDQRHASVEAPGMAWVPEPGEVVDVVLEYVPGYEQAWAELRAPDGTVHLRLPVLGLPATLEHGTYWVGLCGERPSVQAMRLPLARWPAELKWVSLKLEGLNTLVPFASTPSDPKLAFELGNGAALTGRTDEAASHYAKFEELTAGSTDPIHTAWRVEIALTVARVSFASGDHEAARAHALRALEIDPPYTRERISEVRCAQLSQELRTFLRSVIGLPQLPWQPRPAPKPAK